MDRTDHGQEAVQMDHKTLMEVRDLQIGYRGQALLPPLSLEVARGEFWGLVGANGSGKTTMLRTLLGLVPPISGLVARGPGVRLAYVPQRGDLEDRLPGRVLDVVRDGVDRDWSFLAPFRCARERDRIREALEAVGAWDFRHQPVAHLSEGQKQRVEVATALVSEPDLLVLDEPTAAMDFAGEHDVFDLLTDLIRSRGVSVLVVSHHLGLLLEHASRLVVLDRGAGIAVAGDRREVLARPEVQGLLGPGVSGDGPLGEEA